MPYYVNNKILFIHIPKTGGSNIEIQIRKQDKEKLYSGNSNKILEPPYNKISLQHQFFSTLYKYKEQLNLNFNDIKIFTIVRNPYDRVISDLFFFKFIKKDSTSKEIYYKIKDNYLTRNDLDNHNVPQYKFLIDENKNIVKDIMIFKTEDLNNINEEINKKLDININIKKNGVNKDYSKYLNDKSIALINKFYKKDFELFNYKMITPSIFNLVHEKM